MPNRLQQKMPGDLTGAADRSTRFRSAPPSPADAAFPLVADSVTRCSLVTVGIVSLAAAAEWLVHPFSDRYAAVPFVLGLLTLGMWHGAIDSVDIFGQSRWRRVVGSLAKYFFVIVAATVALFWIPFAAINVFLLLTVVHFGSEDTSFLSGPADGASASGPVRPRSSQAEKWSLRLARGLLVIGLPLIMHPQRSADFFRRVQQVIGANPGRFPWENSIFSVPLLVVLLAATVASAVALRNHRHVLRLWCLESLALVAAAVALNPEFFVGLYLLIWHAPRHLVTRFGKKHAANDGRNPVSIAKVAAQPLLFLLPTWAAVAILASVRGDEILPWISRSEAFHATPLLAMISAATVAVYAIVTPPHLLLSCGWLGGRSEPETVRKYAASDESIACGNAASGRRPRTAGHRGEELTRPG